MVSDQANGPTGPKELAKEVFVRLDDYKNLKELAGATGSTNTVQLLDLALSALEWVVENKKAGKRIIATKDDLPEGIHVDELLVNLDNPDVK